MAADHDSAGARTHQAANDIDEGGLARAIGSEEGKNLTLADVETDVF